MADQPYDAVGALGGMFAPAYIAGNQQSQDAVQKWTAENQGMNAGMIDQTRMPPEWQQPEPANPYAGFGGMGYGNYGAGRIPNQLTFGDSRGPVDPEALRIASQGGKYDMNARRDAIAGRVLANTNAQTAYNKSQAANPWSMYGFGSGFMGGWTDPFANEPATSRGGGG